MNVFEIPLIATPQQLYITLSGQQYEFVFLYRNMFMGGWTLDVLDEQGNPIVCGIPLITGADLLQQFAYLGMGGQMWVMTDGDPAAVPTFTNLGSSCHLYWVLQ